ncbi:hypothetical protein GCM10023169_15250 [Georgenia halophila]|uniref:Uncharacterized protein n=1 Tax=Georgenia halophila TaxID=620889 RepID=A0ABP8L4A8_9MICO
MNRDDVTAFCSGLLCANSLPHLATAAAGHQHLTPLGGKTSNRWVNLGWGALNLAGGLALAARPQGGGRRWSGRIVAFDAGAATFALWMAVSEVVMKVNHDVDGR